MVMQKIFNHFLKEVSAITEIEEDVIMSRRKDADIVDARAILDICYIRKGFLLHR